MSEKYTAWDIRNIDFSKREDLYSAVWKEKFRGSAEQNRRLAIALQYPKLRSIFQKELAPTIAARWALMDEISRTSTSQPSRGLRDRISRFFSNALTGARAQSSNIGEKWSSIMKQSTNYVSSKAQSLGKIISAPFERSKRGTTLCSRTAKKNLDRVLWPWIAPQGNARDVHNSYSRQPWMVGEYQRNKWFKDPPEGALAADIFVETGSKHGHRVVAYVNNWNWFVLDPYLSGGRSTEPQPAWAYFSRIQKPVTGVAYYQKWEIWVV